MSSESSHLVRVPGEISQPAPITPRKDLANNGRKRRRRRRTKREEPGPAVEAPVPEELDESTEIETEQTEDPQEPAQTEQTEEDEHEVDYLA